MHPFGGTGGKLRFIDIESYGRYFTGERILQCLLDGGGPCIGIHLSNRNGHFTFIISMGHLYIAIQGNRDSIGYTFFGNRAGDELQFYALAHSIAVTMNRGFASGKN